MNIITSWYRAAFRWLRSCVHTLIYILRQHGWHGVKKLLLRQSWATDDSEDRYIMMWDKHYAEQQSLTIPEEVDLRSWTAISEIPLEILESICHACGRNYEGFMRDMFASQARLYMALHEGEMGSFTWCKSASDWEGGWFIELEPNDVVLFVGYTSLKFRGKRLFAMVLQYAAVKESERGGRIFGDNVVSNAAVLKSLDRAGLRIKETWKNECHVGKEV